jgi:hypothetical protein
VLKFQLISLTRRIIGKLVDAIINPSSKFEEVISEIEAEVKNLYALREAGHIAQATDMMELVSETSLGLSYFVSARRSVLTRYGTVVARISQNFEIQSNAIGTSMEMVNTKLEALLRQTSRKSKLDRPVARV